MSARYKCDCGKVALFGEVHSCDLQDEHWTTYLMPGGEPYFLTGKRPNTAKTSCVETARER